MVLWFWRFAILALAPTVLICRHNPSKSVFVVGYYFGGKVFLSPVVWAIKGALEFRPVNLALPFER